MRSVRLQFFFLQYGSLLSLRFFPLHPGRLMHAFFVVVRGHSDGKVLLERCGKRSTDTVSVRREVCTFSTYVVK